MDAHAVGIDLGGTWIRLRAIDRNGRVLHSYRDHSPAVKELPLRLKKLWHRWRLKPQHLYVASRGIWTPRERDLLARRLHSFARHIAVISDVEAAWLGAFRHSESGILIIAGTGSIAYGQYQGRAQRSGGLGPFLGDEGSGYWIGKQWLTRQAKTPQGLITTLEFLHHLKAPVREIAALAPTVLKQAAHGNAEARAIVHEAQDLLAQEVLHTAKALRWRGPLAVSWAGSLLDNPRFRKGFMQSLRRRSRSVRFVIPRRDPIDALLYDND